MSAQQAVKKLDYACLECGSIVRVRGGLHRQNHFFHIEPNRICFLSGKSMAHLQVQCYLQRLLPEGECFLEHRFPEINRIADVVWVKQKFVFEVQCSAITAVEVSQRNQDYQSIGYQVIWIFHDQQFNQWRVSAAENSLYHYPHYFTNMGQSGSGIIYDQFSLIKGGLRKKNREKLQVNLSKPNFIKPSSRELLVLCTTLPKLVIERVKSADYYFEGDITSFSLQPDFSLKASEFLMEEEKPIEDIESKTLWYWTKSLVRNLVIRPYKLLFQMYLEKACR